MAIQGIINGFADAADLKQHAILVGRGDGYSLVVNGRQCGEQEASLDAGLSALKKACDGRPAGWRVVLETATDSLGALAVTKVGAGVLGDYDLGK